MLLKLISQGLPSAREAHGRAVHRDVQLVGCLLNRGTIEHDSTENICIGRLKGLHLSQAATANIVGPRGLWRVVWEHIDSDNVGSAGAGGSPVIDQRMSQDAIEPRDDFGWLMQRRATRQRLQHGLLKHIVHVSAAAEPSTQKTLERRSVALRRLRDQLLSRQRVVYVGHDVFNMRLLLDLVILIHRTLDESLALLLRRWTPALGSARTGVAAATDFAAAARTGSCAAASATARRIGALTTAALLRLGAV